MGCNAGSKYLVCILLLFIQGCAQQSFLLKGKVTEDQHFSNTEILNRKVKFVELSGVPFFPQTDYQCGPAAVATIANYYHLNKTLEDIIAEIYLPERKGSLQAEVIAEFRSIGLLPYQLSPELENILAEVEAGSPVLVLQNLGTEKIPVWHYAVVEGFDIVNKILILNSGKQERLKVSFKRFHRTWLLAGKWAIVPVPVSQLPASANLETYISTVADMEALGYLESAYTAYSLASQKWPDAKLPLLGLANVSYQLKRYSQSRKYFLQALEQDPEDADIFNNLAYVYAREQCFELAFAAVENALSLQPKNKNYLASKQEIKTWKKNQQKSLCLAY